MSEKRILLIAFHFPPIKGSSGLQRTLSFANYLVADHGWLPTVLTAHPRAYRLQADEQLKDIDKRVKVIRAQAWDASRHFAIRGRYLQKTALPDPWASWYPHAIMLGSREIRASRPQAIWSTFPIATAHNIGASLSRKHRLPWIADFRDSMTEPDYPSDQRTWSAYRRIESETVANASACVFTTPGARQMYISRYEKMPEDKFHIIENGYDETAFDKNADAKLAPSGNGRIKMLHAGLLYRAERDPEHFFAAIAQLRSADEVSAASLEVVLRASGDEAHFEERLEHYEIGDIVTLAPPVPYREALVEMLQSEVLLVFQASNCNHQIPAKVYEYARAGRSILALTDPAGDTGQLVSAMPRASIARIDSTASIQAAIKSQMLMAKESATYPVYDPIVERYSRRRRTAELAELLDCICEPAGQESTN